MKTPRQILFCVALTLIATLLTGGTALTGNSISTYPGVTVRVLAKGAPIAGANGLYFGPDGYLYVASAFGNEIVKLDPDSGRILDRVGPERGVITPDDLTFGPDGSLYWTSIVTGWIGKLTPQGDYVPVANLGQGVNPITFSPDTQWLYVAKDFLGHGLFKLRPDGSSITPLLPDLVNFNGFDFGPDGWLYGPLYTAEPKVIKVNATKPTPLDPATDVVDVLLGIAPSAVKFDSRGRLVTNDNYTGQVLRYDLGTRELEVLATLPFSMDNLAIDARDQVYVSSDADGYVAKILPQGNHRLLSTGGMIFPSGVVALQRADGGESVFVGDLWSLREFDGRTGKSLSIEPAGVISSGLTPLPLGLASDAGNRLLVASALSYRIQEYDAVNHTVLQDHSDPILPGVPFMPVNAVRFQGNIVATDAATGLLVQRVSGGWMPLCQFGGGKVGLATSGSDLWITDYALGTVFRYDPAGLVPVAAGLSGPEGIAYYPPDGSLLVVETNAGRLSKINPATGVVKVLAEGLALGKHLGLDSLFGLTSDAMLDGIAVGPSNAVYVAGNKGNVLYRIEIHR